MTLGPVVIIMVDSDSKRHCSTAGGGRGSDAGSGGTWLWRGTTQSHGQWASVQDGEGWCAWFRSPYKACRIWATIKTWVLCGVRHFSYLNKQKKRKQQQNLVCHRYQKPHLEEQVCPCAWGCELRGLKTLISSHWTPTIKRFIPFYLAWHWCFVAA